MHSLISRFRRDESGATATEYAMLIVFVALAIAIGAQTLATPSATCSPGRVTPLLASRCRRLRRRIPQPVGNGSPFPTGLCRRDRE